MDQAKMVSFPFATNFKLSTKQSTFIAKENGDMRKVLYASEIGSLMYEMVCTRSNIDHAVIIVSCYLSNPRRKQIG